MVQSASWLRTCPAGALLNMRTISTSFVLPPPPTLGLRKVRMSLQGRLAEAADLPAAVDGPVDELDGNVRAGGAANVGDPLPLLLDAFVNALAADSLDGLVAGRAFLAPLLGGLLVFVVVVLVVVIVVIVVRLAAGLLARARSASLAASQKADASSGVASARRFRLASSHLRRVSFTSGSPNRMVRMCRLEIKSRPMAALWPAAFSRCSLAAAKWLLACSLLPALL